jgi:small ligand-binding sensory domain FIST
MTIEAGVGTSDHHNPQRPDAPWAGFYTVGEIGPVAMHNYRHLYTSVDLS